MVKDGPTFTVDLEDYYDALPIEDRAGSERLVYANAMFLLNTLEKYNVKAIFYCLGSVAEEYPHLMLIIRKRGHVIGSHGYWHGHNEKIGDASDFLSRKVLPDSICYRSPYWDTTPMPWPPSGGFFFRALPLWLVKLNSRLSGTFWIHPHDVVEKHPKLKSRFINWKRNIGLKNSRQKLDRLLKEVRFADPSKN